MIAHFDLKGPLRCGGCGALGAQNFALTESLEHPGQYAFLCPICVLKDTLGGADSSEAAAAEAKQRPN